MALVSEMELMRTECGDRLRSKTKHIAIDCHGFTLLGLKMFHISSFWNQGRLLNNRTVTSSIFPPPNGQAEMEAREFGKTSKGTCFKVWASGFVVERKKLDTHRQFWVALVVIWI